MGKLSIFPPEGRAALATICFVFVSAPDQRSLFFISFLRENLYSSSLGGGVATSPMLIVFHGKYSTINPLWHIRHLGESFQEAGEVNFLPCEHHLASTYGPGLQALGMTLATSPP